MTPLVILAVGCGEGEYSQHLAKNPSESESPAKSAPADRSRNARSDANTSHLISNEALRMNRDVVKTGSLTVQVDKVDEAEKQARKIAEAAGGRVDQVGSSDLAGPAPEISMSLRIPVGRFEPVMENLEGLGTRMAKQVSVNDVTEKLIDMKARMKTMLVQEEVVRNMLRKATNLNDSLTINNDLTRLRGEIESIAAQHKSLASQAAHSTLELKLTQKATAVSVASTDPNWFQTSWASAWGAGTSAFRQVVGVLMWILVFSPIWIMGLVAVKWLIRTANGRVAPSVAGEGQRSL